jgi:hypothetical protein
MKRIDVIYAANSPIIYIEGISEGWRYGFDIFQAMELHEKLGEAIECITLNDFEEFVYERYSVRELIEKVERCR